MFGIRTEKTKTLLAAVIGVAVACMLSVNLVSNHQGHPSHTHWHTHQDGTTHQHSHHDEHCAKAGASTIACLQFGTVMPMGIWYPVASKSAAKNCFISVYYTELFRPPILA